MGTSTWSLHTLEEDDARVAAMDRASMSVQMDGDASQPLASQEIDSMNVHSLPSDDTQPIFSIAPIMKKASQQNKGDSKSRGARESEYELYTGSNQTTQSATAFSSHASMSRAHTGLIAPAPSSTTHSSSSQSMRHLQQFPPPNYAPAMIITSASLASQGPDSLSITNAHADLDALNSSYYSEEPSNGQMQY